MDRKKLEKIIGIIRENMMVAGASGFTSSSNPKGPVAGYDPVLKLDHNLQLDLLDLMKK